MNRGIALFVALVTLLAHALAIHNDGQGNIAFPYDQAYVAFRLARNLVFEHQMAWSPGMWAFESHPSVPWVLVCALGERLGPSFHISLNLFVQVTGLACMLAVVVLAAQFRPGRTASLIGPLYLATSGCIAAAAVSGMDTALFTLTALSAFLAHERGHSVAFALLASLCCLVRPEGLALVLAMLVLRLFARPNDDIGPTRIIALPSFVVPIGLFIAVTLVRWRTTGLWIPPVARAYLEPNPGQWKDGAVALRDFFLTSVSPLLLAFPAFHLVRGNLSRTGSHAVFLVLVWFGVVVLAGRGPLPFGESMVPALPFLFLAVQEGMITTLDGLSDLRRNLTYCAFSVCILGSALASKAPGDLGPLRVGRLHERWMEPTGSARYGFNQPLGRMGLHEEIQITARMRKLGLFLRDQLEPGLGILTPWPGAVGYLSHQDVHDLLGRTDPVVRTDPPRPWCRRGSADVVAALAEEFEFVVPLEQAATGPVRLDELARVLWDEVDARGNEPGRLQAIESALARYELVTVPLYEYGRTREPSQGEPFHLLRRRSLEAMPKLTLSRLGGGFVVSVRHDSHQQIVDLVVELVDDRGGCVRLRPTGEAATSRDALMRAALLVYNTGTRNVELVRGSVPLAEEGRRWVELRAWLQNPRCGAEHTWARASATAVIKP